MQIIKITSHSIESSDWLASAAVTNIRHSAGVLVEHGSYSGHLKVQTHSRVRVGRDNTFQGSGVRPLFEQMLLFKGHVVNATPCVKRLHYGVFVLGRVRMFWLSDVTSALLLSFLRSLILFLSNFDVVYLKIISVSLIFMFFLLQSYN